MRARYYNPDIKRFINQDVVIGSITDSPTLNRYAYVNGNPISLTDPFGLSPLLNWLGGITGHDVLDVLGMLPGVGFVFDGINAIWYAAEGDYFNAACSFVSALPGIGDAIGAFSKAGKACKLVTAFHKAGVAGNLILGSYTLGTMADKYLFGDGDFTWKEIASDLFTVAMTGVSMWGSAKDFGTSYCFVAGTLVTTDDGQKPIEEIQVGDRVLSENELTGEVVIKTVTETYVNETDELVHIHVNGETISATPSHPFYVNKFGWTLAGSLKAGDVLVLSNGELVTVEWVQHEILESPIYVYNFEVEDFHTYFVGECGMLVHNGCGDEESHNNDKTLLTGEEWYRYFQEKYGVDNVSWDVHSFDDILSHPSSLRAYSADEISDVLGEGWSKGVYGSNGSGWKFIQDAHPENSVFYHGGGGQHGGAYYGVSSGQTGKIKVVNSEDYIPFFDDNAYIIYEMDW